jgi:hypothetical protein
MEKKSKGGSRFFATFTDDYSKLLVAIPIEKKSQMVALDEKHGSSIGVAERKEAQGGQNGSGKRVREWRDGRILWGERGCPSNDGKVFPGARQSLRRG